MDIQRHFRQPEPPVIKTTEAATDDGSESVNPNGNGDASSPDRTDTSYDQNILDSGGKGLNFKAGVQARVSSQRVESDGRITYSATIDTSVSIAAGVPIGQGKVSVDASYGVSANYKVSLPASAGETPPSSVNPFNPESMPEGSSITISQSEVQNTTLGVSLGPLFAKFGGGTREGGSVRIDALGNNQVQVTAGPTSGISSSVQAGVNIGDVIKGSIGAGWTLDQGNYQTATFDLNTPEGTAAYNQFLLDGTLPTDNGTGISNVAEIYTGTSAHSSTASLTIGNYTIAGSHVNSSSKVTEVTYPDGTIESTTTMATNGTDGSTTTVTQTFHPQQDYPGGPTYLTEDIDAREYQVEFTIPANADGESQAQQLNLALTGNPDPDPPVAFAGGTVTMTFSHEQMQALAASAQSAQVVDGEGNTTYLLPEVVLDPKVHGMDVAATPDQMFYNLFDGNAFASVTDLAVISTQGNGGTIDCDVSVTRE